jgi:hypothetical protein
MVGYSNTTELCVLIGDQSRVRGWAQIGATLEF